MSAAFPEITPKYTSVSPSLADAIHENLAHSSKTTKVLLELVQRVAIIHDDAAVSILNLVDNFKKKISEVNKAKPNCQNESFQKFISRVFEQMENQAKILQSVGSSYTECVAVPLQETVDKKKEIWKTCFFYTNSFQQQIRKKEEDLVKRYKDYNDAANKLKSSTEADKSKQELMYHNSHNTYLLRLSSVNSMHNLLYTHVLPHVVHSIETNQAEMNDSLRHHVKYMFSVQKETLKKISKSVDKIDHATDKIDLVSDLTKFIKKTKGHVKDKTPPQQAFSVPKTDTNRRMSVAIETLDPNFVLNKFTGPNLQRRLAALQQQTGELVDNIATLRAGERQAESKPSKDPSLDDLVELLSICDKEANLNVLLKQMELYTDRVTGFLGPLPSNVLSERKHTRKSPRHHAAPKDGQTPHAFIQSRLMKPSQCYYCQKLVTTFVKGYVCSSCKMVVHKKCATNVPFCGGVDIKARSPSVSDSQLPSPMVSGKTETAEVYDLIDLESGDEFDYFDDDEFDDTFSDEEDEIHNPPSQQFNILQPTVPNQFNQPSLKPTMSNQYNPPEQKFNQQFNSLQSDLARQLSAPPLPNRQPARPTQEDGASARSNSFNNKLPPPILPTKPGVSPKKPTTAAKPSSSPKPTGSKPKPATSTKPAIASNKPVISSKPSLSKKPTLPAKPSKPRECIALYDYRSDESSDLSFTSGSIVQILDKTDAEWWKGRLNNYEGFFPCSYVMELIGNQRAVRALYEFNGENPSEINVDEGQILILLEEQDDWFKLKGVDGEGLVPSSYVEFI